MLKALAYKFPRKFYSSKQFPDVPRPAVENGSGWFATMDEQFGENYLPEPWVPSPHGLRKTEYWCPNMIDAREAGKIKILAAQMTDNVCATCPSQGDFTSGIETHGTFEQAFGYYETRVKLPAGPGLWAAFWLQADSMGRIGAQGKDGSEIDVFESVFHYESTKVGNCLHWDGYADWWGHKGNVTDTGVNQYDGYHTYGLLWTPESYTFFADGKAIWQTNVGGVSRVPSYLRLTVEIRRQELGPYAAKLGEFTNTRANPSVFEIDYVKVWQHEDFLKHVRQPEDFPKLKI